MQRLLSVGLYVVPIIMLGCNPPPQKEDATPIKAERALGEAALTYITEYIQIDDLHQVDPNIAEPADANLVVGLDPADNSLSADIPIATGTFIDWDDLGVDPEKLANHQMTDLNNEKDRDETSFPRSNECVYHSKVLSKMDLTYVAVANNKDYAYLAVQRANNNGDAGYYWIFTKLEPPMEEDLSACKPLEKRLMYDLMPGDVMLAGHFQPSAEPMLVVYVVKDQDPSVTLPMRVTAVEALDFSNTTLWGLKSDAVAAVAVNTTKTEAGSFGAAGVKAVSNGVIEPEIFAEAAVTTEVFTQQGICGAKFYGSVITRSSGSGGTTPDLKDLAGPREYNFGEVEVEASLEETCDDSFGYNATLKGLDKQVVSGAICAWDCTNGTTSFQMNDCDGTYTGAAEGTYTCSVTVTDPSNGCGKTVENLTVQVCYQVGVTATLTGSCEGYFEYGAAKNGGCASSAYAYDWNFPEAGQTSTALSGTIGDLSAGTYSGTVVVTETRTSGKTCQANDTDSADVYLPITVSLTPSVAEMSCEPDDMTTDAVLFTAVALNGAGPYSYQWNVNGFTCAGSQCLIDPPDGDFCADVDLSVTVSDPKCAAVTSEVESYHKETLVTATNN